VEGLILKGGRVIDPASGRDEIADVLIQDGKVAKISPLVPSRNARVINISGKIVVPGLIDMHVHLREPGEEYKETIATGTRAAARGGFTTLVCMPNTRPPVDNASVVRFIQDRARQEGMVNVLVAGAITKDGGGQELSEIRELVEAGVVALSDDGNPVMNSEVMRRALEYSIMWDLPIICHCEDKNLTVEGMINEGYISTVAGLKGIPWVAEDIMVARNLMLAEMTGGKLHIAHVSTRGAVEIIRAAKSKGVPVTAETAPHYFCLTEESLRGYDTNCKINPPLRKEEDVKAIKEGLADGTIDIIATDHAPHATWEKAVEFREAPFGIIGLETAIPLSLTELVGKGIISLKDLLTKMTINPARTLKIDASKGWLGEGADADLTVIDPQKEIVVDPEKFLSKGRNTPFGGWKLKGEAVFVVVGGKLIGEEEKCKD
jgi:dihydroorotase